MGVFLFCDDKRRKGTKKIPHLQIFVGLWVEFRHFLCFLRVDSDRRESSRSACRRCNPCSGLRFLVQSRCCRHLRPRHPGCLFSKGCYAIIDARIIASSRNGLGQELIVRGIRRDKNFQFSCPCFLFYCFAYEHLQKTHFSRKIAIF